VHGAPFKDFKLPENDFQRLNPMINSSFISEPEQHTQNVHPNSEPEFGTTFMSLQPKVKNQVVYKMASLDHVACKGTQNKDWAWYEGNCADKTWKDAGKLPKCSPSGGGVAFVCSGGGRDTGGKMLETLASMQDDIPEYIFPGGCPSTINLTSWNTKLKAALKKNNRVKLCPKIIGYCDADDPSIPGDDVENGTNGKKCVGWFAWGDGCTSGRENFVKLFYEKASDTQKKFCPIVTAVMDHESGFAANARSWDGCYKDKGALGIFQYDSGSKMPIIPVSPAEQFDQFFDTDSDYPNINNMGSTWNTCNTKGAKGATALKQEDYTAALKECKAQKKKLTDPNAFNLSTTPKNLPNSEICEAAENLTHT